MDDAAAPPPADAGAPAEVLVPIELEHVAIPADGLLLVRFGAMLPPEALQPLVFGLSRLIREAGSQAMIVLLDPGMSIDAIPAERLALIGLQRAQPVSVRVH